MKRNRLGLLAVAAMAMIVWAAPLRAEQDGRGADAAPAAEQNPGPSHGGMGAMMKEKLGLTDEQAQRLKEAMKAHHEVMKPLFESRRDLLKTLADQVKSKAPDPDVQGTLDKLKAAQASIEAEQHKFQESAASFLTPTQRAKLLLAMMQRWMMGHGGPGMRGPRREGGHEDEGGE